jgi:hypothetical protein
MYIFFTIFCWNILYSNKCFAITDTQYNDYKNASITIGKWLSKSTSHNDFLSSTPLATKRAGLKFMIAKEPDDQYSSDYGMSLMHAPLDSKVVAAYGVIGANTANLPKYLELERIHIGLGLGNKNDITASFVTTQDMTLTGFGVGYKHVIYNNGPFYFSYRAQYSRSQRDNFFSQQSLTNDVSASVFLLLFDVYGGVRHTTGMIKFNATTPELALPEVKYFSNVSELEYFYGAEMALTTKIRAAIQANKIGDDYSIAGKLSFHFNSLVPDMSNPFVDPRRLKR